MGNAIVPISQIIFDTCYANEASTYREMMKENPNIDRDYIADDIDWDIRDYIHNGNIESIYAPAEFMSNEECEAFDSFILDWNSCFVSSFERLIDMICERI